MDGRWRGLDSSLADMARAGVLLLLSLPLAYAAPGEKRTAWTFDTLLDTARERAQQPYKEPADDLPKSLRDLDYDGYRSIEYRRSQALWAGEGLPFQVEFFHRGYLFSRRVSISVLKDGQAVEVPFSPDLFEYDVNSVQPEDLPGDLGFAGFRLLYPIDRPDRFDEFISFLGASYFRALGAKQVYGASARGLAIGMGLPDEEFPRFESFWIQRPKTFARAITVYALLDSPSVTGAYRLDIRPGSETVVEVDARIFARKTVDALGAAPLTSMYFYGRNGPLRFRGDRPEVHDSDGMLIANEPNEWLWRPLWNPKTLSLSTFEIETLGGFGLMQRDRDPCDYDDTGAFYEKRPSIWVEPLSPWRAGTVRLLELASKGEGQDNIGACWIPQAGLSIGDSLSLRYRLHFGKALPRSEDVSRVVATRWSGSAETGARFEVDFDLGARNSTLSGPLEPVVSAMRGQITAVRTGPDPPGRRWRVTFEATPRPGEIMEMRAALAQSGHGLTEVWSFPWPR